MTMCINFGKNCVGCPNGCVDDRRCYGNCNACICDDCDNHPQNMDEDE